MKPPLTVLMVEDNPADAEMLLHELGRTGMELQWSRVETEPDFLAALDKKPDIILSDYSMPQFSGLLALELLLASGLDIPLILISGTVGEDVAVAAMRRGATDYLLKDRIARLGSAVERAVTEKRLRVERELARQALLESEHRFREMLENISLIAVILDKQGLVTFCNDCLLQLTGWKREEVLGADWFAKFIPESDMEVRRTFFETIEAGAFPNRYENPIKTKDGEIREIIWTNTKFRDAAGHIIGTASIGEDVTKRKHADASLRQSEYEQRQLAERLMTAQAVGKVGSWDTDLATMQVIWSEQTHRIFETNPRAFQPTHQTFLEIIHPEDRDAVDLAFRNSLHNGQEHSFSIEHRVWLPAGGIKIVEEQWRVFRDEQGQPVRAVGTCRDITERKQAEAHIRQLNRVYAVLSDINQTIVREKDFQVIQASVCRIAVEKGKFRMAWIGMLDARTQRVKPTSFAGVADGYLELIDIDLKDESRVKGPTSIALISGRHVVCNDIEHDPLMASWSAEALKRGYRASAAFPLKVGGQIVGTFNLYAGEPDFFDDDELRLLDELAADISFALDVCQREQERQRTEKELRWRTALFEAQVESNIDGILVVDSHGRKIIQNQRLSELWKIPPEISNNRDDAKQVQFITSRTKNPIQFAEKVAHLYTHPNEISHDEVELIDGTLLDRYSSAVRDKDNNYYGRIWAFRDITERRKLEEQLRQSQKMDAIGQLAGGVAHDFNNILAVIQMQAGLMQTEAGLSPSQLEFAREIEASAQRAANLTRQLLMFSRRQAMRLRDLDLNETVTNIAKMLQRILGEDIQMQIKLASQPLFVHADAGMLDQVLMNFAVNSRDAMPKGGLLAIETSIVEFDEFAAGQSPKVRVGSFICLSVSDTGGGIAPEIMPRIFEPFFTTKDVGKGTGLGLATVFGIVQQHQGWINVYSEPGQGTTFRIYLPRLAQSAEATSTASTSTPATLPGGHETVLLVEDDPSLRASVCGALKRLGYRVIEAVSGHDALEIWSQYQGEINLLLTDLVMPGGMTGKELGARLLKENPKLKVIYSSGYSADIVDKNFPLQEGVNFLSKPFQIAKLAQAIRTQLNS